MKERLKSIIDRRDIIRMDSRISDNSGKAIRQENKTEISYASWTTHGNNVGVGPAIALDLRIRKANESVTFFQAKDVLDLTTPGIKPAP